MVAVSYNESPPGVFLVWPCCFQNVNPPALSILNHNLVPAFQVNEMFQDLAVLINDQGHQVVSVDEHITTTAERVKEGKAELVQAQRSQRGVQSKCLWLWLIAALIVSVLLIVLLT